MSQDSPNYKGASASDLYFCIISARYNEALVDQLCARVVEVLRQRGAAKGAISLMRVPGSMELPYAAYMQAMSGQFDAIVALGVVIAGDTAHHQTIEQSTARAFHEIAMRTEIPVINGVLTVGNQQQAAERCGPKFDRGAEFAGAAIEMASHKVELVARLDALEAYGDNGNEDDDDPFGGFLTKN